MFCILNYTIFELEWNFLLLQLIQMIRHIPIRLLIKIWWNVTVLYLIVSFDNINYSIHFYGSHNENGKYQYLFFYDFFVLSFY